MAGTSNHIPHIVWDIITCPCPTYLLVAQQSSWYPSKLDMSTTSRRLKSPQSLSGTSAHPTMVTLVNIMVMNGWLTSFSFCDLEISTPRSRSWVWSKGKVIQSAQYHINSPRFHFTTTISAISKFDLETSKVKVMREVKGQGHILFPSIQPMHLLFVSHQSDQPFQRYGQNSVWPWKNTSKIFNENLPKQKFQTKHLQNIIR